jgi:hypothetical protein
MVKPAWFDWLTVAAILLGPVLALSAQRILDWLREKRQRRVQLYLQLIATRASYLSPDHVQALNSIDVVFSRRGDRPVRLAWEKFLAHVATPTNNPGWNQHYTDLKLDLLQMMGSRVGYNFSIDYLRRQIYSPAGYAQTEQENVQLRQQLLKILTNEGLKIKAVVEGPPNQP